MTQLVQLRTYSVRPITGSLSHLVLVISYLRKVSKYSVFSLSITQLVTLCVFFTSVLSLQKREWDFVASATIIFFLHVFSDYKRGDDISLHAPPSISSVHLFWLQKTAWPYHCPADNDVKKDLAPGNLKRRHRWGRFYYIHFSQKKNHIHENYSGNMELIPHDVPRRKWVILCTVECVSSSLDLEFMLGENDMCYYYSEIFGCHEYMMYPQRNEPLYMMGKQGICSWFVMYPLLNVYARVLRWFDD